MKPLLPFCLRKPAAGWLHAGGAVWCAAILAGCSTAPVKTASPSSSSQPPIQELNLLSMPVALNLDAQPGADGVAVKIFASIAASEKTAAIVEGKLEILMYDGIIPPGTRDIPPALHTWVYSPQDLKSQASVKSVGVGYELVLAWGADRPNKKNVTLIARHVSNRGQTVYSGPVTVTVSSF